MQRRMKTVLMVVLAGMLVLTAACSSGKGGNENAGGAAQNGGGETNTAAGGASNEPAEGAAADPLGKYDPAITVRTTLVDTAKDYLVDGDTLENNVWTRGYEEELGIKVAYDWIVDNASSADKMNVTLASGDLPDILVVNQTQFKQLLDADQLEDLTDEYEKYGSEMLKQFYTAGADGLKSVRQDGKLYGLSDYSGSYDSSPMIWIRTDWMKKLNLQPPKTMDELIAIATAFAEKDPDGNGKKDTFGIALSKNINADWSIKVDAFMNGYHAFPDIWLKGDDGKLVFGSIQPEVKTALAKLQELYKNGVIDKEFGTKDVNQAAESVMAGKAGMFFGPMASPFLISGMVKDGSNADWMAYPVPSADDQPVQVYNRIQNTVTFAVRKGFEHPEALVKMMNFAVEKLYGENSATEGPKYLGPSGQAFHAAPVKLLKPNKNIDMYHNVVKALEANDPSGLVSEEKGYYDGIQKYRAGDKSQWWNEVIFGPESSQKVIQQYIDNDQIIIDQFVYPPTATMGTKKATLDKMQLETFTKIIYGAASIDEFDTFVANWKKLGGDQITEEVNAIAE